MYATACIPCRPSLSAKKYIYFASQQSFQLSHKVCKKKQTNKNKKTNRLRADCHALEGYEICHVLGDYLVLSAGEQYFSRYPTELSVHLNEY